MRLLMVLLILSFLIAGCSSVRTYTYVQDRVDQNVQRGNRGYLMGTPPPAGSREGLKRTMIGVDVVIPLMPWEKKAAQSQQSGDDEYLQIPEREQEKTIFKMPFSRRSEK